MLAFDVMRIKDYLVDEFNRRLTKNESYSLRAFARDLGMSPQKLHLVINGKSGLSSTAARSLVEKLKISEQEKEKFILYVDSRHHRSKVARQIATEKLQALTGGEAESNVAEEKFKIISEWYYLPIILLFDLKKDFVNPMMIAKALDLPEEKVSDALAKLVQAGLIVKNDSGYQKAATHQSFSAENSSIELIKYYREMLLVAEKTLALHQELRHFSIILTSMSEKDLEYAKEEINQFRKKLGRQLSLRSKEPDSIYGLSIQFFPVIRKKQL